MTEEMIDVVDENDEVIDTIPKREWWGTNRLHRGATIFIFNSKGEIFVHKRTSTKKIYPSMYDTSCGGGVIAGESYQEAALRELEEETGIKNVPLKFLFKTRFKNQEDNCYVKVYSCLYDGKITIQPEEIEKGFFITLEKLKEMMKQKPFCPDAIMFFNKYLEEFHNERRI